MIHVFPRNNFKNQSNSTALVECWFNYPVVCRRICINVTMYVETTLWNSYFCIMLQTFRITRSTHLRKLIQKKNRRNFKTCYTLCNVYCVKPFLWRHGNHDFINEYIVTVVSHYIVIDVFNKVEHTYMLVQNMHYESKCIALAIHFSYQHFTFTKGMSFYMLHTRFRENVNLRICFKLA